MTIAATVTARVIGHPRTEPGSAAQGDAVVVPVEVHAGVPLRLELFALREPAGALRGAVPGDLVAVSGSLLFGGRASWTLSVESVASIERRRLAA